MGDPLENTGDGQAIFHSWQSAFITRYINSIELSSAALSDITVSTVSVPDPIRTEIKLLKELTKKYVINSRQLATQQHGKRKVIQDLFEILMDALNTSSNEDKYRKYLLPEDYAYQIQQITDALERHGISSEDSIHARFAADIISSLTDTEALALHKRLMGTNPGSVLDIVVYSGFHLH